MKIDITNKSDLEEEIKVKISKDDKKSYKKAINNSIGRELGEELIDTVEDGACNKSESDHKKPAEEIKDLLVPLAIYEAKSAFYKLKIAKVVAFEGAKLAKKGAITAAKGAKIASSRVNTMVKNHKEKKENR